MSDRVPDFKDSGGQWIYRFTKEKGCRYFTRAGLLFHAMKQRVNPAGDKQKKSPLYKDCINNFENFQDFASWCQLQIGYNEDFQLDKDLLLRGNKIYCKESCVFIPQEINKLITKRQRFRGEYPIGVQADRGSIRASCQTGTGRATVLGYFKDAGEAFLAYKTFKEAHIKSVANKWKDQIDPRAYQALMNYEVLITD